MSDAVARAVGAGGGKTIMIGTKECVVRPLGIGELTELERDCLERYKRQFLKTYSDNLDLFPEKERVGILAQKMDEAARWDVEDLPKKEAYDPKRINITDKLKQWVVATLQPSADATDLVLTQMAATALDQGMLSAEQYQSLTGGSPVKLLIPYVNWWITGSFDGMISVIWTCFRRSGVTRQEITDELGTNMQLLVEISREIERLSAPEPKNG